MRCLIANAAPVPYALKQEIIEKLGDGFLYEVYGSTELGIVTVLKPEDQLRKPGLVRQAVRRRSRSGSSTDDGADAAPGEPGELFIRTGARDGRLPPHRGAAHRARRRRRGSRSATSRTLDDEGYLYICDRKKDMIISGGVNIYPAEIEAVLYQHPQVLDAAVFGIPDDEWGESVYAIVQAKPGESLDLDELERVRRVRAVARYKRPRAYELRDELPRTDAGKLLKRVAARRVLAGPRRQRCDGHRPTRTLSEADVEARCSREYGVPVPARATAPSTPTTAVAAAEELGVPGRAEAVRATRSRTRPNAASCGSGCGDADGARRRRRRSSPPHGPTTATVALLVAPMVRGEPRAHRRGRTATRSSGRA